MTTKIDGTNGVLQSYDYQVLTTGFSYTFAAGTTTLIAAPAGTLATGTITMPVAPADGMVVTIESTQQVTSVTVQGNTGQTLTGAPSQLIPNQPLSFVYRLTNTTWYAIAGGAGRASPLVSGTATASTSGTAVNFTGIPSWAKRITVMFSGVSTSGTSKVILQIGDAGGVEITGYLGTSLVSGVAATNYSSGFITDDRASAAAVRHGILTLCLVNPATYTWAFATQIGLSDNNLAAFGAGTKSLSDTLNQVRVTTVNGTDTFDAGSINIMYE